jgi:hypothetical protein
VMVPIRMVCRENPYLDKHGRLWDADQYVTGGKTVFRSTRISAPDDPELYRGERYGSLLYRIPVPAGKYKVVLRFCETWFGPGQPGGGGVGQRVFDVLCNGMMLERNLDVFRTAGSPGRGLRRVYSHVEPNPQGKIVLALTPHRNYAELNAIEILDEAE